MSKALLGTMEAFDTKPPLEPTKVSKMPQRAFKRNSTQLTTKSIVLTKSQNYIEEKLEAEEVRRIQETLHQKK